MIGIEVTLPVYDGRKALGVIFPDDTVYVHEPISDSYASQADLLADHPNATVKVLGPIMSLNLAMEILEEKHSQNLESLERSRQLTEAEYQSSMAFLKKYLPDGPEAA